MELFVDDLIPKKVKEMKFLFLLESPYFDEAIFHFPLAGRTGKNITNFFRKESINLSIPQNYPLGCFLKNNNLETRIGIMNCSNIPLDIKVYSDLELNIDNNIIARDRIRRYPKKKANDRNDELDKRLHNELYEDFERRLLSYTKKNDKFIIISCGFLAKTFLSEALECNSNALKQYNEIGKIIFVPHPSFNLWHRIRYEKEVQILIQALKNYL